MATLNTMRAVLKDARMREQAGAIRKDPAPALPTMSNGCG
jgi:DNA recombination protein RmuC